ncbi:hypothetical protein J437_LFUL018918 [Ladona fulva]|uniref:Immunoglobulin I-set domain-containing protein n=1 Tax=Ladona fulva TaxID=123851 RepID=A0A8K0KVX1_LADFU|nr:hypothetical protein J437_LFUL018918 [Ladona fulva]
MLNSVIYSFYRNTQIIRESRETTITFDGTYARLSISSCKKEHSGSYKIVVSNEFGKEESYAELKVTEVKKVEKVCQFTYHLFNTLWNQNNISFPGNI